MSNNNLSTQSNNAKKTPFSIALQGDAYQNMINNTIKDEKRRNQFVASISSAVATNPALQECTAASIISCALLGESLQLSPSPQLGWYYMIPFNKKDVGKVATFILGYKGYIQLAIRSGYYKKLNVISIKKGELLSYNVLDEEIEFQQITDELERESAETIGYYAMFEYNNGFKKAIYWSKEKMERHALEFSPGYRAKKGSTFWEKDFDSMAYKTMLRHLISRWGIMSVEMQDALDNDDKAVSYSEETQQFIGSEVEEAVYSESEPKIEEKQKSTNGKQQSLDEL